MAASPQEAFFLQAESDWGMFRRLQVTQPSPDCHALHYLQMTVEKLAKSYDWLLRGQTNQESHKFVALWRCMGDSRQLAVAMGMEKTQFEAMMLGLVELVADIEQLHPSLARDGANCEYPWPRENPTTAPVEWRFSLASTLETANGRKLIHTLGRLIESRFFGQSVTE